MWPVQIILTLLAKVEHRLKGGTCHGTLQTEDTPIGADSDLAKRNGYWSDVTDPH